ncbi:alpha/beta fold hydrolase [Proteiniphilum acetatigenes]|uniref:alpha/beta fold hydrolase n=1 Tax=Proteiniphilum acetatigenes TaxID=294710 RepID=UPI00036EBC09|nr:alpha/beta fold hydrolase [Proteiniphilum acetatigenes]
MKQSVLIGLLFLFFIPNIYSGRTENNDHSDSLKRKAELDWILSLLPPDATQRGRVSYLDKTFKDWLNRTGELPPDFDQMPSIPFLPDPLVMDEGKNNIPITTLEQWKNQREWMKEQLAYYITGTIPPPPDNLQSNIISETKEGDITIRTVELAFGPDHKAKLTLELIVPPGEGPFPVFLTNWNHRQWAQIAVKRGYIGCLYAGADAKDDTEYYSEIWAGQYDFTRLMRRAYGASRAIDYLYTLPYVEKDKIGITGHSRNGKTSLMAAAFDERIGACITSSGGTGAEVPWRYNSHKYDVEDIALLACAQPAWLHPRLRFFIGREHKLPVDQNFFMSLIAPRGLMLSTATYESSSNIFGMEQAFRSAKRTYQFLNAKDNLATISRYGLHGVDANSLEGYIDFFDFIFGRNNRKPENRSFHNYSFEKWLEITNEKIEPSDYKIVEKDFSSYKSNTPHHIEKWEKERKTIKDNIRWILGNEPAGAINRGPKSLKDGGIGEQSIGTLLKRPHETNSMKIMAITPYKGFGENLFGYLYYPVDSKGNIKDAKLPIVIYLHEYDYSKGFSTKGYDHEIQSVFENLTRMGFGVLSFDMLGFGNRMEEGLYFYERYPKWSKMGKMVTDVRSAVDAASHLDFVDNSKIFVAGYSLGGTVALLSAAMDERIAGVVSIAGFTPMRTNKLDRGTEGIKAYSHLHGTIPKLGFFAGHEDRIPVDFDEIIASIAPRPVLLVAPLLDKDIHIEDIRSCVEDVERIYDLHKVKDNIQLFIPNDYNRFSTISREHMYEWLAPHRFSQQNDIDKNDKILLSEDAAWCWFSDPRAIYHNGKKEVVYFSYINSNGDVIIKSMELGSKKTDEFTLHKALQIDDHNVPGLLMLPDGKLLAFYCQHNGNIFTRKSKAAENISEWEEETILLKRDDKNRYCYVNPVMLSEENNRIYLFGRNIVRNSSGTYSDTRTYCIYSDDLGLTWSKEFNILDNLGLNSRQYLKVASDNKSRIDFLFTNGHPGEGDNISVYHMYYEKDNFRQTNGTYITSFEKDIPIGINKINKIYDADATSVRAWIWDIVLDKENRPVVTYALYPSFTNHQYYYARWNGKEWINTKIVDAGKYITIIKPGEKLREPHYSGGIVLDHNNPDKIFLSRQIDDKFEIEKRVIGKNGEQRIQLITSNSKADNIRPFVISRKNQGPSILLWMEGHYYHYTDFNTNLNYRDIK